MSKEIDDYINEQVAAGRGTKQQILEQFAKSDDAELTAYAAQANKTKTDETKKTMIDLATTANPVIGINPAELALYAGGVGLAFQAGKQIANLAGQGIQNVGGRMGNAIFGKAGSSAPPPSASTQDLMATPNVEKTPIANKLALESEAKFGVPLSDVEKHFDVKITNLKDAEILSNSYKNSLPGAVSNQLAGVPTIQPNVPANPTGAFAQPSGYSQAAPQQTLTQAVETGGDVGTALKADVAKMVDEAAAVPPPAELRTGTGKPAYAGQGPVAPVSKKGKTQFYENYGSLAEVPSTHAFVPNAQFIDPLRQDLGPKAYKEAYTVRNFPASNEIAREEAKTINRELGRATREEAKLAGLPPAEITPGITERTTKGYKKVVVGGLGAGALVALPNLASAAQQGDAKAAAEAIGYAIPGISQLLSVRDINKAYKEGGWPAAAHMAADVASMGGLSGAEHLLSYVPKQKTELPSINKPRLGAIPPAFSQYYR